MLIRRYPHGAMGTEVLLSSHSPDGTTASLRLTGERLGRYYAADLQEGTPKKGDQVIARRLPEGSNAPSTPVPQVPVSPENAPWTKNFPGS